MIFYLLDNFRFRAAQWGRIKQVGTWLKAAPAVLAALAWVALGVLFAVSKPPAVEARYVKVADEALAARDYHTAYLASQRLLKLESAQRPAHIMRLANSMKGLGNLELALTLAAQVAPMDVPGYPPAHFFIADNVMREVGPSTNSLRIVEPHLRNLLATQPDHLAAQVLLGQYYCKIGDWRQGRDWFLKAYPRRNDLALQLSEAENMLHRPVEARQWAEKAVAYFRAETQRDPQTDTLRLQWAESELQLNHLTNALLILEEGIKQSNHRSYREFAARLIAQQVIEVIASSPTNHAARLDLLKRGLEYDPQNKTLIIELIRLTHAEKNDNGPAVTYLRELRNRVEYRANLNYYAGMEAWNRNDLASARDYLLGAYSADPDNAILANNLAYLLTLADPPNPQRGLDIINTVLKRYPDSPVFRETRGQVLLKLEKWGDAAADFEFSRRFFPKQPGLHESLALAYANLGNPGRSAEYQRLAKLLRAQTPATNQIKSRQP
jgi:predicted Zn-dependent protease